MPNYRDRIIGIKRIPANKLIANPKNWRTHPRDQKDAMRGLLKEVGIVNSVLGYETPEGIMLIDGHLRQDLTGDQEIPVTIVDVTPEEADLILATHDPIAAMAGADNEKIDAILKDIQTNDQSIADLLASIAGAHTSEMSGGNSGGKGGGSFLDADADFVDKSGKVEQYTIIFDNADQKESWFKLVRKLNQNYQGLDTIGARVAAHAEDYCDDIESDETCPET